VYCPLPLNHVGGMQMVAGAALFAGGTFNFREKFDVRTDWVGYTSQTVILH